jgi:hypothetical protein
VGDRGPERRSGHLALELPVSIQKAFYNLGWKPTSITDLYSLTASPCPDYRWSRQILLHDLCGDPAAFADIKSALGGPPPYGRGISEIQLDCWFGNSASIRNCQATPLGPGTNF